MIPANKPPLLGLCPIGKFVFSHEDAVRQKEALQANLRAWGVRFVDLDGVLEDGLVRDQRHVDTVVDHFRREGIDCLFLPHCNFGTEGAAGLLAHKLDVPTLLWGPRDDAPLADGTRPRDTLCGLFATSKVLHRLGVRYSYIENCAMDAPMLREGVEAFLRAAHVANALTRGTRIGVIGQRIDFFWTTIINEGELLERFQVELVPIDLVTFLRHVQDRVRNHRGAYEEEAAVLRQTWTMEGLGEEELLRILAVRDQMLELAVDHGLEGLAVQDFMSLIEEVGAWCFLASGWVAERYGYGVETDVHGALSSVLLRRASLGVEPTFLVDLTVRHPEDDNAVLLWHAGAPPSMRDPADPPRVGPHWILPGPYSGMPRFRLKEGDITCVRFDGDRGSYAMAIGEGRTTPGPETLNNYVWMRVNNWPHWERTLIEGPFLHHIAMAYGHHGRALRQACRFVPGLELVDLDQG